MNESPQMRRGGVVAASELETRIELRSVHLTLQYPTKRMGRICLSYAVENRYLAILLCLHRSPAAPPPPPQTAIRYREGERLSRCLVGRKNSLTREKKKGNQDSLKKPLSRFRLGVRAAPTSPFGKQHRDPKGGGAACATKRHPAAERP